MAKKRTKAEQLSFTRFTPSINIVRENENEFKYILTENATRVISQLEADVQKGIRTFTLIGSYGTGKSAFMLALTQTLSGIKNHFGRSIKLFTPSNTEVKTVVGVFAPLATVLKSEFNASSERTKDILKALHTYTTKSQKTLVLIIDEFGKFLEYSAVNESEDGLYFLQELAEYAAAPNNNIVVLTTLHQGFATYARKLSIEQRQEWEKVKGRFKEITFNEQVEQLIKLASSHLIDTFENKPTEHDKHVIKNVNRISNELQLIGYSKEFLDSIGSDIYPFDILSINVLTQALKRYGQNERSLFTFLEANDHKGINDRLYTEANSFFSIANVYDFLAYNYYHYLTAKDNPDLAAWTGLRRSLERIDVDFQGLLEEASAIVKVIGLLNIFGSESGKINNSFVVEYVVQVFGFGRKEVEQALDLLRKRKVVRFIEFKSRFVLTEGTDVDIEYELQRIEAETDNVHDVPAELNEFFKFPVLAAKRSHYKFGTPRYFQYHISDEPITDIPNGEIDGYINLLFPVPSGKANDILPNDNFPILYATYQNTTEIKRMLYEIRKIRNLRGKNYIEEDKVADLQLRELLEYDVHTLNKLVINSLFDSDVVSWFWNGKEIKIDNPDELNVKLSQVCDEVYFATPMFRNELVNRHKLSTPISSARYKFFDALVDNWREEDLGFPAKAYPPEKTIYLTLLKETGIHQAMLSGYDLTIPTEQSFQKLWQTCEDFLHQSLISKKNINELVQILESAPFKLKHGFVEFFLPAFLFTKRHDIALYEGESLIPKIQSDTLDLFVKNPERFYVKSYDIKGVKVDLYSKYKEFLNLTSTDDDGIVDVFRPFVRFYRDLNEYARTTNSVSPSARGLRIAIAKSTDPEKALFEDIPAALGYHDFNLKEHIKYLPDFILQLENAIRELRTAYSDLLIRVEMCLLDKLGFNGITFPEYRLKIKERYSGIKQHMLSQQHRVFYSRIMSEIEDKDLWISALIGGVLGKPSNNILDEDEELVMDRITAFLKDLDLSNDLSGMVVDEGKEDAIHIEILKFGENPYTANMRLRKGIEKQVGVVKEKFKSKLSKDETVNISALLDLLKELLPK